MAQSLVYSSPALYEAIMLVLYGRHYESRYRAIARLIPDGASVLDLCCGPGVLYQRHLKLRSVVYTGLDLNRRFIARLRRNGGNGMVWNLEDGRTLPSADYVVMQASLYQFLPDPSPIVRRMFEAAVRQVIIAEPIRNLSSGKIPLLSRFAQRQANAGAGDRAGRFDEDSLDAFISSLRFPIATSFLTPGGREKVFVLSTHREGSGDADSAR